MNFKTLSVKEKNEMADLMFAPAETIEALRDWIRLFLGLEIPNYITDLESNSNPMDAIWAIYNAFRTNSGDVTPGFILLSSRESMKCQVKGTKLLTPNGVKEIENITVGDTVWTGFSWQKVTNFFDEGLKPAVEVKVHGGVSVTGTPIHRYWALRDGEEQWIRSQDLDPETDLLCVNLDTGIKENSEILNLEEYEIGYFLGQMTGDGGCTLMDSYGRFNFSTIDTYSKNFFEYFMKKYFPGVNFRYDESNVSYVVCSRKSIAKLKEWGLKTAYSYEKEIPEYCFSNIDAMKGFICGLFDSDGCWGVKGECLYQLSAGKLIDQLQTVFLSFGIDSMVKHNTKLYGIQKHKMSRLEINQTECRKFALLGLEFKSFKAGSYKVNKIPNTHDCLPIDQVKWFLELCNNYGYIQVRHRKILKKSGSLLSGAYAGVSRAKLGHLVEWMEENNDHGLIAKEDFQKVLKMKKILKNKWKIFSKENVEEKHFFDITVENEHSYWSNGLISHNTVSVSVIETLLLLHFQLDIAHAAATETQASVGLKYAEGFIHQMLPLMEARGWESMTANKRLIQYRTPEGKTPFIKVLIASAKGFNSLHSNVLFVDELDLADPIALKQSKNIVGYSKGIYGITVYLSTRKYSFGCMSEALDKAEDMNWKVLRWNILDVTEKCPETRHKPDLPKQDLYVAKSLPLITLDFESYGRLSDIEKIKYDKITDAHAGCASCLLAPICRMKLAEKKSDAVGGFYKPLTTVIQKFRENDPETAESELLCWRPGSEGLVYPRFKNSKENGNILSLEMAYNKLCAINNLQQGHPSEGNFIKLLKDTQTEMYACGDFGFSNETAIIIAAKLSNGEIWVVDAFSSPGLELSDVVDVAISFRDTYTVIKWFMDPADPSRLKTFSRNLMKAPQFKKSVIAGIESVRSKIVTAAGVRNFFVVDTPKTKKVVAAIMKHRFILDKDGGQSMKPDDEAGTADLCDSLRYLGQNLFPIKGTQKMSSAWMEPGQSGAHMTVNERMAQSQNENVMRQAVQSATGVVKSSTVGANGKRGSFKFSF